MHRHEIHTGTYARMWAYVDMEACLHARCILVQGWLQTLIPGKRRTYFYGVALLVLPPHAVQNAR